MPALQLGPADLDTAFDADAMEQVTQRLSAWCRGAALSGQAPVELVGETTNAAMRIGNVASAVRNYRQFREASAMTASTWPALDDLRARFLDRVPEFEGFDQTDNEYERVERVYKDAMIVAVRAIIDSTDGNEEAGRRIFRALIPNEGPLLRWQTDDDFARKFPALAPVFYAAIGQLARHGGSIVDAIMAAAMTFAELRQQGATVLTLGEISSVALTVAGIVRPDASAPFKISKAQSLAKLLTGDPVFTGNALERDQVERWLELLRHVEKVMRGDWNWHPRDLIDVQGFAWTALDDKWKVEEEMDDAAVLARFSSRHFDQWRQGWSAQQITAFCEIARSAHEIGLDWYHTNMPHNPVRLGRKPSKDRRAKATLGYLDQPSAPRLWLSDKPGRPQIGANAFLLDKAGAEAFDATLAQHYDEIVAWEAPEPLRPGRWPDETGIEMLADNVPIWIVTARDGEVDGFAGFIDRGEWHLTDDRGGRINDLVRAMQLGDRIVMRDYIPAARDLPFAAQGKRVTALHIRATGIVTAQSGDGRSVGVDWTVLPEPRLWYFYTNNDPVWRLRIVEEEMAGMLAAFVFDGVRQDYDWFVARWFTVEATEEDKMVMPDPTNLILYGPPGTGKTYATAAHAVRLCDGLSIEDLIFGNDRRDALMKRYGELVKAERIEFVTFHQSTAYEEFVEGLRPSTVDEDGQQLTAGFRLAATPGIFRTIARRAELSTGPASQAFTVGDRQVFKMSIGDATKAEWAWLFDEAIAEGYAYLGFGDIDWSDDRYADRAAILAAVLEHEGPRGEFAEGTEPSLQAGPVKSPDLFRNGLHVGDVIVVAKGLSLFRAIGVVEGPYEYAPRGDGRYSHRRKVRWLWHDEDGVAVAEINAKRLSIETIYRLNRDNLNVPALERYANSRHQTGGGTSEPLVLVIDEINRANISKVFGELITLLEPDKRLGKVNEIKVRLPYSGDVFGVPANLHIIGTMNTADRSIALLDTALRRRFDFCEMMPDASILPHVPGINLRALLTRLNERIEYLFDREHQIGHAFFMHCKTRTDVDGVMRRKVLPLLAEYFHEDWGKIAAVLGDAKGKRFLERVVLAAPDGLESEYGDERYRWSVRANFADDAYIGLA